MHLLSCIQSGQENLIKGLGLLNPLHIFDPSSNQLIHLLLLSGSVGSVWNDSSEFILLYLLQKGTHHTAVLVSPYPSPFLFTLSTNLSLVLDSEARLVNILLKWSVLINILTLALGKTVVQIQNKSVERILHRQPHTPQRIQFLHSVFACQDLYPSLRLLPLPLWDTMIF